MGLAHQSGDAGGHFGRSVGKRAWCAGRGGFVSGHAGRNRPVSRRLGAAPGRNVRIISVQKIQENEANSGAQANWNLRNLCSTRTTRTWRQSHKNCPGGIDLRFRRWRHDRGHLSDRSAMKAGTLSDAALWHQCYFDPPETFTVSNPPAVISSSCCDCADFKTAGLLSADSE